MSYKRPSNIDNLYLELSRIAEVKTDKERIMEIALRKLAVLGNGERPGNSNGNEIAIIALRDIGEKV